MKIKILILIIILSLFNCQEKKEESGNVNQITNDKITGGFDRQKYPILQEAIVLKENNSLDKAIKKFNEAESIYGPMTSIYLNRGVTFFRKGETEKSITDFSECLSLNNDHYAALTNRGIAYVHNKQYEKSIKDLDKAILIKPKEPATYLNRAIAYYNLDNKDLACKDLNQSKELGLVKTYGSGTIPLYLKIACAF